MAQKRGGRGRPRKKRPTKQQQHTLSWVGALFVVFASLAFFRLGIVGTVLANVFRLVVGDSFLVVSAATIVTGIWFLLADRLPKLARHVWVGLAIVLIAALVLLTANTMATLNVHSHYLLTTWRLLQNDFGLMTTASQVGGGLLGAFLFSLLAPLLSSLGATILAWFGVIAGVLVFLGVGADQVFSWLQAFGQACKRGVLQIYSSFVDLKKEHAKKVAARSTTSAAKPKPAVVSTDAQTDPASERADDFTINGPAPVPPAPQSEAPVKAAPPSSAVAPASQKPAAVHDTDSDIPAADYQLPSLNMLTATPPVDQSAEYQAIKTNRTKLKDTFESFGVKVAVKSATLGPSITQYEIQPAVGVKVSKIVNLSDDLALALAAKDIRIEAPIPGKSLIGIEVPNQHIATVGFKEVMAETPKAPNHPLVLPLGRDVNGKVVTFDLTKMPHLLIAGATGSGKSVMINVILTSILMRAKPTDVRLMLIDPKRVELSVYNGVPHLLTPVVTEAKKALSALNKILTAMDERYQRFAAAGVRNMKEFNQKVAADPASGQTKMPYIVVIIDELSDLMMVAGHEIETAIVRLAQMARAAGIHVIIATQRPSVDVITGLMKANIPSRIAFATSSGIDSRTILDSNGAEKLLGRGDMLFSPIGASKPLRIQGAFIPSVDVERVVKAITDQVSPAYVESMAPTESVETEQQGDSEDELYDDAKAFVISQQSASTSMLQRRFRIGYNRAARLIDDLEANQIVGPSEGSKPRKVFATPESATNANQS
ncbi:FtsK/SpoIIIE family DNA translocase [Lacticaseibacillus chiayiensis]|uniref:FtsK/SpoIIIE family DNA translocase n=1 Tax=Lacticaseibacillus chiayiensis TaxID=2100821 RepID=UPI001012C576|nr:DNA translocase FtsK [Lacticaseibacillus chiayiensis]RXT59406.1 cell division protein FtsK [Lacticaseibacillus chiayiensis]